MIARFLATVLLICAGLWALDEFGLGPWIEGDRAHIARLSADLASVKQASDDAVRIQMAASEAIESRYSALVKESNDAHQIYTERAQGAVARYAAAHPVRLCAKAVGGSPSGAGVASLPANPALPVEPDAAADLVALSRSDFDQLTSAAVQSALSQQWLQALVDEGLAIPAPEF